MAANYLMSLDSFRSDPRREMADFMASVYATPVQGLDEWLKKPFTNAELREALEAVLRNANPQAAL